MMNSSNNCNENNVIKRKHKRSFMQQVKKKFKKGPLVSEGDKTDYDYFLRILELERSFDGTLEEKRVFANNALVQTENCEVESSTNHLKSRVIENLLPFASLEILERYFEAFGANLRPICTHQFSSHVLQTLMLISAEYTLGGVEDTKPKHVEKCKMWLVKVSKFLLNNVEEFVWDQYASKAMHTALLCLCGNPREDKHSKVNNQSGPELQKPPEEYVDLLKDFSKKISNWPQLKDLFYYPVTSSFLQTLVFSLNQVGSKSHSSLCKQILTLYSEDVPSVMCSTPALFLLDAIVELRDSKWHKKIYNKLLSGRLKDMAKDKTASLTLQKFLNNCTCQEILSELVSVLLPEIENIMSAKNSALLVSICYACEREKLAQSEFFKSLLKYLNYDSSNDSGKEMVSAILSLTPLPHEESKEISETKNGSLVLQHLLKFQKPIKVVNALLSLEPKMLADLLSSQYGSFLTTAFCESEFIGEKSRLRLMQQLMNYYSYLAQSKFGSRTFDSIWSIADMQYKEKIVRDLSSNFSEVMKTTFGQFVASKVFLELYRTQGTLVWQKKIWSIQSTKNLFANIIGKT